MSQNVEENISRSVVVGVLKDSVCAERKGDKEIERRGGRGRQTAAGYEVAHKAGPVILVKRADFS